jgi:hypothetical protein
MSTTVDKNITSVSRQTINGLNETLETKQTNHGTSVQNRINPQKITADTKLP